MVSTLYVYETLHGGESESTHYDELREWDVEPDLVGIEGDPEAVKSDGLLTRSPGTSVALALNAWFHRFRTGSRSLDRNNWFADFAAARRFAGKVGVPIVELDRRTHGEYVGSLSRTRCVGETMLALVVAFAILLFPVFSPVASVGPSSSGLLGTGLEAVVGGAIAAILPAVTGIVVLTVIRWSYGGWLIETRPTEMVETVVESSADCDADTALLVVATWHTDAVRERAEAEGVEVEVRSSPVTREYDGGSSTRHRLLQTFGPA